MIEKLEPGKIFCYRTRAFNDCGGNSGETPEVMITMPPGPAPYKFAPPTPANMSAESVSGHAVYHVTAGPFPGVSGTYNGSAYYQNQVIEYDKSTDGINWVVTKRSERSPQHSGLSHDCHGYGYITWLHLLLPRPRLQRLRMGDGIFGQLWP